MTTLYIRPPAQASIDSALAGLAPQCRYALAGDDGALMLQGEAALDSLRGPIAKARRVLLLLAAPDVTLLRVKVPPLSKVRLAAALPNLVEDQILGDPAGCVLAAGAQAADGMRTVAVAQRAVLEAQVKTLLEQGARGVKALPAQLCLPLLPGTVSAALRSDPAGLELTLRLGQYEGIGLALPPSLPEALQVLRACAGAAPVILYLAPEQGAVRQASAGLPGITLEDEHWGHWIAGADTVSIDLAAALGMAASRGPDWRRWRWPLRLALLALAVNIAGINLEWLRQKREADQLRAAVVQTFKASYPNETPLLPAAQMRRNIAAAMLAGGQAGADEFTALAAAFGAAMNSLPVKDVLAALEYRERVLIVKLKPDTVDAAAMAQVRAELAGRNLQLTEPAPGTWHIGSAVAVNTGTKS